MKYVSFMFDKLSYFTYCMNDVHSFSIYFEILAVSYDFLKTYLVPHTCRNYFMYFVHVEFYAQNLGESSRNTRMNTVFKYCSKLFSNTYNILLILKKN